MIGKVIIVIRCVYALQKYIEYIVVVMQFNLFVCGGMVPTRLWSRRTYLLLSVLCRLPHPIRRQRQLFVYYYQGGICR